MTCETAPQDRATFYHRRRGFGRSMRLLGGARTASATMAMRHRIRFPRTRTSRLPGRGSTVGGVLSRPTHENREPSDESSSFRGAESKAVIAGHDHSSDASRRCGRATGRTTTESRSGPARTMRPRGRDQERATSRSGARSGISVQRRSWRHLDARDPAEAKTAVQPHRRTSRRLLMRTRSSVHPRGASA